MTPQHTRSRDDEPRRRTGDDINSIVGAIARSGRSRSGNGAGSGGYRNKLERGAAFAPLTCTLRSHALSRGTPPSGAKNARKVAKYRDFGPVESYISESVQDRR